MSTGGGCWQRDAIAAFMLDDPNQDVDAGRGAQRAAAAMRRVFALRRPSGPTGAGEAAGGKTKKKTKDKPQYDLARLGRQVGERDGYDWPVLFYGDRFACVRGDTMLDLALRNRKSAALLHALVRMGAPAANLRGPAAWREQKQARVQRHGTLEGSLCYVPPSQQWLVASGGGGGGGGGAPLSDNPSAAASAGPWAQGLSLWQRRHFVWSPEEESLQALVALVAQQGQPEMSVTPDYAIKLSPPDLTTAATEELRALRASRAEAIRQQLAAARAAGEGHREAAAARLAEVARVAAARRTPEALHAASEVNRLFKVGHRRNPLLPARWERASVALQKRARGVLARRVCEAARAAARVARHDADARARAAWHNRRVALANLDAAPGATAAFAALIVVTAATGEDDDDDDDDDDGDGDELEKEKEEEEEERKRAAEQGEEEPLSPALSALSVEDEDASGRFGEEAAAEDRAVEAVAAAARQDAYAASLCLFEVAAAAAWQGGRASLWCCADSEAACDQWVNAINEGKRGIPRGVRSYAASFGALVQARGGGGGGGGGEGGGTGRQ